MTRSAWLVLALSVGCGGAAERDTETTPAPRPTNGSPERAATATEGPPRSPLSTVPECDAYLRVYARCGPTLALEIAAGNRRTFDAERSWLEYLAGTPEVAGLPSSCSAQTRELQAVCP